ncbi:unnamed protein product [Closterium sp. NIES-53]
MGPFYCSYSPAGAATALAAAATAHAAAATAPSAASPAPVTAATALLVQLQPLLLLLQPLLLPLQPLLLPLQPLLLQLQPCWCSSSPCCCCYSPCCCRYSPCCCLLLLHALLLLLSAAAASQRAAATAACAAPATTAAAATAACSASPANCRSLLLLLLAATAPCYCCCWWRCCWVCWGAEGATGSVGGAAGAGGAGPTTDHHCLSWPLSRQLQQLGVDSGGHCLSWTTPPLSSFASGFFSEPVQVVEALAAALGASESAAALGASESAAALGARASPATGPSSAEALHTFTLDSGASRCFFRDCTSLTPLAAPVPVSMADPTGGPVVARASTVLPCPAVPSGSLSGLHLPTFSTNLVSNVAIQDVWVDTFIPRGQRVAIRTCSWIGRPLAMFTQCPGSSLYTLTTASAQVAAAGQVAASSQVSASSQLVVSCSCRVLSHQTLLWHHCLGHPSLPRLHGMHSRLLVYGLPRSLPSRARLPCRAFPASRGGSAPLLTPPSFLRPLLLCRLST